MSNIQVTVRKFNPAADDAAHYETYEIPWHESMSVLEALRYIHEELDPTSFDHNCRAVSCGLCAMKINGMPALACGAVIAEGQDVTVEPLDRFPVIRDLMVDKTQLRERILSIAPQFMRETPMVNPMPMTPEGYQKTAILQQCRECGICYSVCPVVGSMGLNAYAGPAVMTKLAARYYDEREGKSEERLRSAVANGLFNCIGCGMCTSVCPKGSVLDMGDGEYSFIDHVRYFSDMKEAAREMGLEPVAEEPQRPVDMSTIEIPEGSVEGLL